MKIFYSPLSPFVRKVLVLAHERGIHDRLELVTEQPSPVAKNATIAAHNPSGKVPTLLLDDGTALFDSRVIVEYIDGLPGGAKMIPSDGARWHALRLQSLADEMTDALVLLRYETALRPEALRWQAWIDGQWSKVNGTLDDLEKSHATHLATRLDIGTIAVACGLGYLDFRFSESKWRGTRPVLARWYDEFRERPSMKKTAPA